MKLKNLFAITAIASALVLTGCKEEKKADAASTAPAPTSIKVGVMAGPPSCRNRGKSSKRQIQLKC